MKKFIISTFLIICCITSFTLHTAANELGKWFNPKLLRVYVQPKNPRTEMMKRAFAEWARSTNNKFAFRYISSPEPAEIQVYFVNTIPEEKSDRAIGLTSYKKSKRGRMLCATIYIAEKTQDGRQLGRDAVYTVMLHEIGHAMGITQHSKDPLSIMYPTENDAQEILKSDLKTLADIYGWE